ncbi:MAG: DUF2085 domain-containing protein [Myxococcales bacterium]|nr:DUF2085 domain-containing protein [Myxococcales bacterium]
MLSWLERLPGKTLARLVRAFLLLVGIAPLATPVVADVPVLGRVARLFETWFEFQCHREIGRSFAIFGHTMPVCTRCFGIYLGLGLGALVLRPRLDVWPLRIWVGVAALAMILDVVTENLAMRPPSDWVRFITGALLAYPVGAALVHAAEGEPVPAASAGQPEDA